MGLLTILQITILQRSNLQKFVVKLLIGTVQICNKTIIFFKLTIKRLGSSTKGQEGSKCFRKCLLYSSIVIALTTNYGTAFAMSLSIVTFHIPVVVLSQQKFYQSKANQIQHFRLMRNHLPHKQGR